MSDRELCLLSAGELAAAYAEKNLSPVEVAEAVCARAAAREPELNALYLFDAEQVRAVARRSEQRWAAGNPRGRFDGVAATIKENIAWHGRPMPGGTALPDPPVPPQNAPITDRLLEAGVVIVGVTVMPDWGMLSSGVSSRHGITRNAWNPALTAGGSSSGAGTAAAAGYGPWHVGSDIGGSIRLPGTWQGLATLKPSAGLVPLDVPYHGRAAGPLCRTVDDLALLMRLLARPDWRDYTARPYPAQDWRLAWAPAGRRIGLQLDAGSGEPVDDAVKAAVTAAAGLFAEAGAEIIELDGFCPPDALAGVDAFWRARSLADLEDQPPELRKQVLPYIVRWCEAAAAYSAAQTVRNYNKMAEIAKLTRLGSSGIDLVLSPVTPAPAFPAHHEMPHDNPDLPMAHISFTLPYNMSGQPAGTVNCGRTGDGRFIGLQIAGQLGADAVTVAAMRWFEAHRGPDAEVDWALVR